MSTIIIPNRWTRQPTGMVEVDWNHPITRDLTFFCSPFSGIICDIAKNRTIVPNGVNSTVINAMSGKAINFNGSQNNLEVSFGDVTDIDGIRAITVDFDTHINSNTNAKPFNKWDNGNAFLVQYSAGNILWVVDNGAGTRSRRDTTDTPIVANIRNHVSCSFKDSGTVSNDGKIYVNGKLSAMTNVSNACTGIGNVAAALQFGRSQGAPSSITGNMQFARIWKRSLDISEVVSLYENPWQICKPLVKRIYVSPAAAAGGFQAAWATRKSKIIGAGVN